MTVPPLVCIVMPVFNAAPYLESTLKSIRQQTFEDWCLLAVDDASTDSSLSLLQDAANLDPRVKVISRIHNSGNPAVARNDGLDACESKYVAFADADDLWHPRKLQEQLDFLKKSDYRFVSSTRVPFFDEPPHLSGYARPSYEHLTFRRLLRKNVITTSTVLVERSAVGRSRFPSEKRMIGTEDYYFWTLLHRSLSHSAILNRPLCAYRVHAGSVSRSKTRMLRANVAFYRRLARERMISRFSIGIRLLGYVWYSLLRSVRWKLFRSPL